jgi:hypothetical protein
VGDVGATLVVARFEVIIAGGACRRPYWVLFESECFQNAKGKNDSIE